MSDAATATFHGTRPHDDTSHPLRRIWVAPGRTVAQIVHDNPGFALHALPALAGLSYAFYDPWHYATAYVLGDRGELPVGPLANLLALYITSYVLTAAAALVGARVTPAALRVAIAWSYVPMIALLPLDLLGTALASEFAFEEGMAPSTWAAGAALAFFAVQGVARTWSWLILVRGVAAVSYLSTARAILCVVVSGLLSGATMLALTVVAMRASPLPKDLVSRLSGLG